MMVGKVVKYKLKGAVAQAPTKRPELFSRKALQLWSLVDDTRNLKYENFKKITVRYPSDRREQTAIAKVLSTADREIDLLRQDIDQEKQKKKALMQLLLTGIVRVTPCH